MLETIWREDLERALMVYRYIENFEMETWQ